MDLNSLKSEGDVNISLLRAQWTRDNIDAETQAWLVPVAHALSSVKTCRRDQ